VVRFFTTTCHEKNDYSIIQPQTVEFTQNTATVSKFALFSSQNPLGTTHGAIGYFRRQSR
jgi:hypothetical protein